MSRSPFLTPRWLVAHVLIVVLSVTFVRLGVWQLDRLDERRSENERLRERLAEPPLQLGDVADLSADDEPRVEALEYRPIEVTGTYRTDEEVLQRSRAHRGQNGYHVLTPLETTAGPVVLVRRGWVPYALDEPPVAEALPPDGTVTVTGYLERSETQASIGPTDPEDGELAHVFRADVPRIDRQVAGELWPMIVRLESQTPAQPELPRPAERPEFDEQNHLSYALQWFSFALIATVGYGFVLRSRLREDDDAPTSDPDRTPVTRGA